MNTTSIHISKSAIQNDLFEILRDMMRDWDLDLDDGIGPETRLIADLEFESIDVVQLVVAIEERYGRGGLPFEELLMEDGRYVDEIVIGDVVDFLHQHLARRENPTWNRPRPATPGHDGRPLNKEPR